MLHVLEVDLNLMEAQSMSSMDLLGANQSGQGREKRSSGTAVRPSCEWMCHPGFLLNDELLGLLSICLGSVPRHRHEYGRTTRTRHHRSHSLTLYVYAPRGHAGASLATVTASSKSIQAR